MSLLSGPTYGSLVDLDAQAGCREPSSPRAHYDLVVEDLLADDWEVELVLWRMLVGDYPSAVRAEAVLPSGCVLEHHLERQQDVVEDGSWMLALLDVDGALGGRGYPTGVRADLVLAVPDPAMPDPAVPDAAVPVPTRPYPTVPDTTVPDPTGPEDSGTRRVRVEGGRALVQAAVGVEPDATVSPADLAGMFSGHLDPVTARRQGRLQSDEPTALLLRTLFAGPPAWLARPF